MAKGEKSGGGFDKKHEKNPKERGGDGCAPSYRGREKHFQRIKKGVVLN